MPIINTDKVMRARDPHDHYPTDDGVCDAALAHFAEGYPPSRVLDPGAGAGPWGRAVRRYYPTARPYIIGVDRFATEHAPGYDAWAVADYCTWRPSERFDLICGNPPYSLAEAFIRHSYDLLAPGGVLIFLLRLAFLEGQQRGASLWHELPPSHVGVLSRRPSFTDNGKTDATAYAFFRWQQGWIGGEPRLSWIDWKANARAHQRTLLEAGA